ncbi:hypothetical protein GUITHDRAFT_135270 [Guillardia theta CCMP2712]|uniref:CENP-V/GFA domain-containing protein n=1 Tax=Guillardia theta (strain CCMP2712) TaxID=905079 RepID=L1JQT4_GUITC|nr:hypothetical protein GUITHDRAFT_135270 [Guillardia theta CCMP2712]EKX50654.1 hypothetical protein GUITHDRAFT_135270 [Guillardia theta CCMP2712]|eukprot:XP_005837634.1 hypothetical protein GUITHDRAFT_135270 [Guillardia theta CCMP2712]
MTWQRTQKADGVISKDSFHDRRRRRAQQGERCDPDACELGGKTNEVASPGSPNDSKHSPDEHVDQRVDAKRRREFDNHDNGELCARFTATVPSKKVERATAGDDDADDSDSRQLYDYLTPSDLKLTPQALVSTRVRRSLRVEKEGEEEVVVEVKSSAGQHVVHAHRKGYRVTCLCGEVAVNCEGDPLFSAYCHCKECRRTTGAPVFHGAGFEKEQVKISFTSSSSSFSLSPSSSPPPPSSSSSLGSYVANRMIRYFCKMCGTYVFGDCRETCMADVIEVPCALMEDPPPPQFHAYVLERLSCLSLNDDLPQHEDWPLKMRANEER